MKQNKEPQGSCVPDMCEEKKGAGIGAQESRKDHVIMRPHGSSQWRNVKGSEQRMGGLQHDVKQATLSAIVVGASNKTKAEEG